MDIGELETVSVTSLEYDPENVRLHDEENLDAIKSSLARFGQVEALLIQENGVVIGGNGRLRAMREMGWREVEIRRVVGATRDQIRALAIALNRTAELATWDSEALREQLKELAEADYEIKDLGFKDLDFSFADVSGHNRTTSTGELDTKTYTGKIKSPVYEPSGVSPRVSDLVDRSKTEDLQGEISKADLPEEVAEFLFWAAERHSVFNYRRIADFYAEADKKTQALMEKSALVIIDFNAAIENGFVQLTDRLGALVELEGWSGDEP